MKNQPKTGHHRHHDSLDSQVTGSAGSALWCWSTNIKLQASRRHRWSMDGSTPNFRNVAWFRASETKNFGVGDFLRNEKCITLQKSWTVRRGEEILEKRVNSNPLRTWDLTALHGISPTSKTRLDFGGSETRGVFCPKSPFFVCLC